MGKIDRKDYPLKRGGEFVIRTGAVADAVTLLRVTREVLEERDYLLTEPEEFHLTIQEEKDWIESYLDHPCRLLIVAEADDDIVGILDFRNGIRNRNMHTGTLGMLVTKPYRNQGVGKALLQTLLDWATAHPVIEKVALSVFADNLKAQALYRKMGFIEEGRRPREYKRNGEYIDDIMMYRFVNQ